MGGKEGGALVIFAFAGLSKCYQAVLMQLVLPRIKVFALVLAVMNKRSANLKGFQRIKRSM
jgi:hypothetical protein